jgi:hypothetical protein
MIEICDFHISMYGLTQVLIFGAILFVILKLLRKGLSLLLFPTVYRPLVIRILPAAGALLWMAFAYWAVRTLIENRYYSAFAWMAILVIVMVWISWFALKDCFAGLILKIHDDYEEKQHLKVGSIEGTIRKMGLLDVEIEQENGDRVKIPYGRISGEIHWKSKRNEESNYYRFVIHVAGNISVDSILDRLRLSILNTPWAASNREPHIKVLGRRDNEVNCEVGVYALSADYFHALERDIKRQMGCLN